MVAVMVERTAFRRLDASLHAAENALIEWGRWRNRDRAPNDIYGQAPFYSGMAKDWLLDARTDPPQEPDWMPLMVQFYVRQAPLVQEFMRLRWQHGRTTDQTRAKLRMSVRKANDLVRMLRDAVRRDVLAM